MDEENIEILNKAIKIEEFGSYYYNSMKKAVENNEGQGLLTYLANAEKEHKERLETMLSRFGGETEKTEIDVLIADILMDKGEETIFKELMGKTKLEQIDAIEAVKLGIGVEARSIKFYEDSSKRSPEQDIVDLFLELVDMEKEHFELLSENLRGLKDEGTWYGYVPILEG
jgi:rubrerythrin